MTLPGPIKTDCVCGCGRFGTPRKKLWRGETIGHVRDCPCRKCMGSRHKKNAGNRERRIAKQLGGERSVLSGGVSGYDISTQLVEIEETSNKTLTRGLFRWWDSKQVQTKMARLMGRHLRVRVFLASEGGKPRLAVMPFEDFKILLEMASEKSAKIVARRVNT